jgi:hypothetical protein
MAVTTQGKVLLYTYYIIILATLIAGIVKKPSLFLSYFSGGIVTLISAYVVVFDTDCLVTGFCNKYSWFRTFITTLILIIPFVITMTIKESDTNSNQEQATKDESKNSEPQSTTPNIVSIDLSSRRSTEITNNSSSSNESSSSNVNTGVN